MNITYDINYGDFLGNLRKFLGNFLEFFWKFSGNFLGIFWEFFGNFWEFSGNFFKRFMQLRCESPSANMFPESVTTGQKKYEGTFDLNQMQKLVQLLTLSEKTYAHGLANA